MPAAQGGNRQAAEALLLGRASVLAAGREVALPTRKALALVAYLALEGHTERSKLSELLWTDLDRASARGNLRRELYRLRATPLWTLLEVSADQLGFGSAMPTDVAAFGAHLDAERLAEALALYRGPLLCDLELQGAEAFELWLAERRGRLAEAHQAALARHSRALEAGGDLRGALAAQLDLLRRDELQEGAHREVMRLYGMLGERGLALRQFERLRNILGRELGLDPLPETVALAERVRAAEPAPPPDPAPPTPALSPPLIGRERAWEELERCRSGLCLILAEAGVGKTRLAEDFARSRGGRVLVRGLEASSQTPLSALADALRSAHADPSARARLERLDAVWRREAAWLVPELGPALEGSAPSPEGRARFLEGLARALAAAAGPGGTVVFDDLQWCDASTIEVALHLTRLAPASELRLLATARPAELSANPAATRTLASLEHGGQLQRIDLEPLGDLEVLALVRALSGGSGAQLFSRRLHAATEGNPLYILETLRALFATGLLQSGEGGWSTPFDQATSDYAELPIAPSVQDAVLRRVDALGGATRRLLELASLAGNGFRLELLGGASALSEWEQFEALERALAAHLITPLGAGYRFSHELVRRALEGAILPERRQLSHRRLAANLARAGGAPGQIADHFERGAEAAEAVPYRVRAAEASARVFSRKEALDEYRRALQDGPGQRTAVQIHLARAELLAAMDRYLAVDAELRLASRKVSGLDDPALAARVMLAEAGLHNAQGRYLEGLALTERVLAQGELPELLRPGALYERGNALLRLGRLAEAEPCLRAALAQILAGTPDDAHDLSGRINAHLQACAMQRGDLPLAQSHNAAALRAFQLAGSRAGAARALGGSGLLLGLLGDAQAATPVLEDALNEAREIGDVGLQRTLLLNLFKFLLEQGELEAAVPRLEEGLALAREPQDPYLEGIFLNNLGVVHRHRGDLGAALRAFDGALALADQIGIVAHQVRRRLTFAENHLDLGDPEGALERIEEARQLAAPDGLGELQAWLGNLLARCELARGRPAAALSRLETLLASSLTLEADDRARTLGLLGLAHLTLGAPRAALDHLGLLELPLDPLLSGWLLTVRLRAHTRLGLPAPEDTARAEDLLASDRFFPLEALVLRRALAEALDAAGEPGRAREQREAALTTARRLAASLEGFEPLQRHFLDTCRDLEG